VQELLGSKAQFVLFKFSTNLTDSVIRQWLVEDSNSYILIAKLFAFATLLLPSARDWGWALIVP
jgi:hypothetical protein